MKNGLIRILSSLFIIFTLLTLFSCNNTSKKITVSEDTINEVSIEESEIIKSIAAAEKLLDEGKLQEAKEYFNKAIRIDKTNKDTYLRIKDKYLSINNTDEAYSIIKTAITNNVDTENMKLILKEISSKFELIKLPFTVYQDSNYSLPNEVSINMYDTEISIPITWSTTTVDTSNLGTFTYEGYNDEYGRKVIIDLTIIENVYDKQIGCIKNIYSINGKTYIDIDLVEFYLGDEISLAEAIKDNNAGINEKGEYFLPNPYYIRNNYSKLTTYEISKDCLIQLMDVDYLTLGYGIDYIDKLSPLNPVSFDDFKKYIDKRNKILLNNIEKGEDKIIADRTTLCWLEIKNDIVYSIYRQYTP